MKKYKQILKFQTILSYEIIQNMCRENNSINSYQVSFDMNCFQHAYFVRFHGLNWFEILKDKLNWKDKPIVPSIDYKQELSY